MPWIGRKSYALVDERSDNKINKRPKRKMWKLIILGVLLIIIGIGSWVGYAGWHAIKNITSGSNQKSSFFKFLGGNGSKKLQGENRDRINILLMGIEAKNHPGGNLTDTIMLLSIQPKEKKFALLSIPRDFYTKLPNGSYGKINAVHSQGEAKKTGGGPVALSKTVAEITGQPIDYYIRTNFDGFKEIIDTLGGVDINNQTKLYDPQYPCDSGSGYCPFSLKAGQQHLNANIALKYARCRKGSCGSDFGRAKRQQDLLLAMKDRATSLGIISNPAKIIKMINSIGNNIFSNFSPEELTRLIQLSKDFDSTNIHQAVLDTSPGGLLVSSTGTSAGDILKPRAGDNSEIKKLAANIFQDTASNTKAKTEAATIEVQNATGQSGNATDVATILTDYGYKASPYLQLITTTSETVLYDYTNGTKKTTADFLTSKFNARKIKKTPTDTTNVDFTLILGTNYLDLIKKTNQ